MELTSSSRLRKRLLSEEGATPCEDRPGKIDIAGCATMAYSSEDTTHPVEHLVDGVGGPGGSYWASGRPNTTERLVLEFDEPQRVSCVVYEAEERSQERTQEVRVEVSTDHGRSYRQVLAQDYTFSPRGATFQHEELRMEPQPITHLRLTVVPNKGGAGVASLTSLILYA